MSRSPARSSALRGALLTTAVLCAACAPSTDEALDVDSASPPATAGGPLDRSAWPVPSDARLFSVEGLVAPEAVKYDPIADVYLVSNWGDGDDAEANDGFVSRVAASDGAMLEMRWIAGSDRVLLQEPRGMAFTGDTLWIADVRGVHAFDRATGAPIGFVDLSATEPGFLNDVAAGPDGSVWLTDTGASRLIRIEPAAALAGVEAGTPSVEGADGPARAGRGWSVVAEGPAVGSPNGITWDGHGSRFVLAPWEAGGDSVRAFDPSANRFTLVARSPAGLRFDGIEALPGRPGAFVVASQGDSALHVVDEDGGFPWQRVPARPADIAIDTERHRVAVPYVSEDRVDVYALPGSG